LTPRDKVKSTMIPMAGSANLANKKSTSHLELILSPASSERDNCSLHDIANANNPYQQIAEKNSKEGTSRSRLSGQPSHGSQQRGNGESDARPIRNNRAFK
jgi:hypothetical protein